MAQAKRGESSAECPADWVASQCYQATDYRGSTCYCFGVTGGYVCRRAKRQADHAGRGGQSVHPAGHSVLADSDRCWLRKLLQWPGGCRHCRKIPPRRQNVRYHPHGLDHAGHEWIQSLRRNQGTGKEIQHSRVIETVHLRLLIPSRTR